MAYGTHASSEAGIAPEIKVPPGLTGGLMLLWRGLEDWRQRRRTNRLVSSLPFELQKDIGWPGGYEHPSTKAR